MKVIYKKTILDKIHEAIRDAMDENRQIEKIILTREEFQELRGELRNYYNKIIYTDEPEVVYGVPVMKEED